MATDLHIAARRVVSVNPATGEALREFECASESEVHAAVARARAAQPAWAALGVRRRIAILRDFQRLLHHKKSEVAQLVTREAGKPYVEALLTEVLVVLDAARFLHRKRVQVAARRARAARQSGHEDQVRPPASRTLWRDRNHLALELSLFDSCDGKPGGAGGGKCGGGEALGVYLA